MKNEVAEAINAAGGINFVIKDLNKYLVALSNRPNLISELHELIITESGITELSDMAYKHAALEGKNSKEDLEKIDKAIQRVALLMQLKIEIIAKWIPISRKEIEEFLMR